MFWKSLYQISAYLRFINHLICKFSFSLPPSNNGQKIESTSTPQTPNFTWNYTFVFRAHEYSLPQRTHHRRVNSRRISATACQVCTSSREGKMAGISSRPRNSMLSGDSCHGDRRCAPLHLHPVWDNPPESPSNLLSSPFYIRNNFLVHKSGTCCFLKPVLQFSVWSTPTLSPIDLCDDRGGVFLCVCVFYPLSPSSDSPRFLVSLRRFWEFSPA